MDGSDPRPRPEWRPVPGPVDREGFEEAQRRHRRASWRWTLACLVAVALIGIPLSAALSPLLLAVVVLVNDAINLVANTPDLLGPYRDALDGQPVADFPGLIATLVIVLLVPGMAALSACWIVVRRLFRKTGTAAELLAMGAREPRPDDFEERQLVNVVGEIAIAAGLPPPSVHLIDSPVANAAVTGSSPADAAVVVSRGLLAHLSRDETQGLIAHLIGRVGNGDLRIARTTTCFYSTLGLCSAVLTAPTDRRARRALGLVIGRGPSRHRQDMAAEAPIALLNVQAGGNSEEIEQKGCFSIVLLPVLAGQFAFVLNQLIFSNLLITPLLKRAWRARTNLADATAVELTRHPDGLAAGLVALTRVGGVIPGTETVAHLFVVGGEASGAKASMPAPGLRGFRAKKRQHDAELAAAAAKHPSPLSGFQPKIGRRVSALRSLGATVDFEQPDRHLGFGAKLFIALVGVPLLVVFYIVMLGITALATGVAFAIYGLFLLTPISIVDVILRGRP